MSISTRSPHTIRTLSRRTTLRRVLTQASLVLFIFSLFPASPTQARTYNPNNIITDAELWAPNALSKAAVQAFLSRENSVLATFTQVVDGKTQTAAEIIWNAAQTYGVNPKFLLAKVEKEQALITKTQASAKTLDWATGYGCYGGGCIEKFRGFATQVAAAAETQQIYAQKKTVFGYQVGKTATTIDNYTVTPENQATANLFIYTPYVGYAPELGITSPYGGNRFFWRIWHRYFSSQPYVDGQVLRSGDDFWLVKNAQKLKFATKAILLADHTEAEAFTVSPAMLSAYPDGPQISFAHNSLVRAASGQYFLVTAGQKSPIADASIALALQANVHIASTDPAATAASIPTVPDSALNGLMVGPLIASADYYPQGKLFRDGAGAYWWAESSIRHLVDSTVWQNRFNGRSADPLPDTVATWTIGVPIGLKDGTFLNVAGSYYLISNGERMKIPDPSVLTRVFGADRQAGALTVSQAVLDMHPAGEPIDYIDDAPQDPQGPGAATPDATPTAQYSAQLVDTQPHILSFKIGTQQTITAIYRNTGTTTWEKGAVWLTVRDRGVTASSTVGAVQFSTARVAPGEQASFTTTLRILDNQAGLIPKDFTLWQSAEGEPKAFAQAGKFIDAEPTATATIVKTTIPKSIAKSTGRMTVRVEIKNTSTKEIWLSNKTALRVTMPDGAVSPFYDSADWIRKDAAAVPANATSIKPGKTGIFTFVLNVKKIPKGTQTIAISLWQLDKAGRRIFIDGQPDWQKDIVIK